jgi:sarcosine oxidase subunit delta
MLRIPCPFCGLRDHTEFHHAGSAETERPALDNDDVRAWSRYLFLRDNRRGLHREYWQHVFGCRQWLIVSRDTASHQISSVTPARSEDRR